MGSVVETSVSCKLFDEQFFDDACGIPNSYDLLLKDLPINRRYIANPNNYLDWSVYCQLLEKMESITTDERITAVGYSGPTRGFKFNKPLQNMANYFANSKMIYWALVKWYVPNYFPCVKAQYEDLSDGRIRITFSIDPKMHPMPRSFHLIWKTSLEATPNTLGQPFALIHADCTSHREVFTITPPPSLTIYDRLKRAWRVVFAARSAIEELSRQQDQIHIHYKELLALETKLTEQQVRLDLASQLTHASKMSALGEIAAGIAHEINNPLAVIQGVNDLLRYDVISEPIDRQALLKRIETNERMIKRIARVVTGLRSFARDTGDSPFETVSLSKILSETLDLCRERFHDAGIALKETTFPNDLDISCRPDQISQVILNILNNAYDAAQSSTEKWIRIAMTNTGTFIELSIEDSGAGISEANREKIFQPFFTTKEVGQGTGLGLSSSEGIIKTHRGELIFDKFSPHTRFLIRLPRAVKG